MLASHTGGHGYVCISIDAESKRKKTWDRWSMEPKIGTIKKVMGNNCAQRDIDYIAHRASNGVHKCGPSTITNANKKHQRGSCL